MSWLSEIVHAIVKPLRQEFSSLRKIAGIHSGKNDRLQVSPSVASAPGGSPPYPPYITTLTSDQIAALGSDQIAALTTEDLSLLTIEQLDAFTPLQISEFSTNQIVALSPNQIAALTTTQVQSGLTTSQVVALTTDQAASLTTSQIVALTTDQVQSGLTTDQLVALTTAELAALTTDQLVALTTVQVAALTTDQIQSGLSTDQIAALTTTDIAALTTTQVQSGLTTAQVVALTTAQVAALTTDQLVALTTTQISALETQDVAALQTSQIAALTTDEVASGLSTSQVAALTTDQVASLTTNQIAVLTTDQVQSGLTTDQLAALTTTELVALTTTQIQIGLTTAQVIALSTTQLSALGTDQIASLSSSQMTALTTAYPTGLPAEYYTFVSPIVLDLNGNGISTQSINNAVQFDIAASGQKVNTGWIAGGDGLLVLDRNNDGVINDGSELFGTATVLPNGERAANGYAAMQAMDSNGDRVLNKADAGWAQLKVWVDANSDGVSQANELKTLDSLGIVQLDLNPAASNAADNGNLIGLVSSYQTADGATHQMADVWFQTTSHSLATAAPATSSLAANVGGLAQAIASFGVAPASGQGGTTGVLNNLSGATGSVAVPVNSMVDVLKAFDVNGNAQGSAPVSASPVATTTITNQTNLVAGMLTVGH